MAIIVNLSPDLIMHLVTKSQNEGPNMKGNLFFHLRTPLLKRRRKEKPGPRCCALSDLCLFGWEASLVRKVKADSCGRERTQLSVSYLFLLKDPLFWGRERKDNIIPLVSSAVKLMGVHVSSLPIPIGINSTEMVPPTPADALDFSFILIFGVPCPLRKAIIECYHRTTPDSSFMLVFILEQKSAHFDKGPETKYFQLCRW